MKPFSNLLLLLLLLVAACGKPSDQQTSDSDDHDEYDSPNHALYDQVMDIHDEVMPKMEDIYKLKSRLQEEIANSPDMVIEKKESLEKMILQLDSANNAMMDWMHQFNPPTDSVDEEQARAYLETQMENIKKVRETMLTAIEKATEEAPNN